mgnify:FL=1
MKRSQPRLLAASIAALLVSLPAWQSLQAQEAPSTAETGASAAPQSDTATAAPDNTAASTPVAETAASTATTGSAASTSTQGTSLRRIWAWMQPISSQGVRADVLARALTASTTNDQGRQVAVPWSQAMPGGTPLTGTGHENRRLQQNQLEGNTLQYISHTDQDTSDISLGLEQSRTEVSWGLPSGELDNLKWSRPGTPLLSVGQSAFNILEVRTSGSTWFRRRHSASVQASSELVLKQGERIPFEQVIQDWNSGTGPQRIQLMLLKGERRDQFRVCFNINTILVHRLTCNVWQVPGSYWRNPQPLQYVGPYLEIAGNNGENLYLRYPQ